MPLYIGLMSGTSMDGIDAALVSIDDGRLRLEHTLSRDYDPSLRGALVALATGERDSLHDLGVLDRAVGEAFGAAVVDLLGNSGWTREDITAIGSHGQTVRHFPSADLHQRYSLQIGDPATIAESTGICTVADFRRQDIAAGGQGAPLVPPFHAAQFGNDAELRAIVNIGGIANASLVTGRSVVEGFDCGPGNTLMDAWALRHLGRPYDAQGAWGAEHEVLPDLFERLSADPYFSATGPRSTGPEHFSAKWLDSQLSGGEKAGNVQATLTELTAWSIAKSLNPHLDSLRGVFVCGGGARNTDLMRRLHTRLSRHDVRLGVTDELGLAAEWVEASAFAWLAHRRLDGLPGNEPLVTGARGYRPLGAVHAPPAT